MDHREHSHYPASIRQDHERQIIILHPDEIEEAEIPAKYEVCPDCDGRGKYVNPAIDSHGLTVEDFADDPDFQHDYFAGTYDITCRSCQGRNVILVPATDEEQKQMCEILDEERNCRMEVAAERRMCGYY